MKVNGTPSNRAERIADRAFDDISSLPKQDAASLRAVRRRLSSELAHEPGPLVTAVALELLKRDAPGRNVVAYEILRYHPDARRRLRASDLRELGASMRSWSDADVFACYVAGRAWRDRQVGDAEIHRWARSQELWWRRAALVCTVPLNVKSQGGRGDPTRTLGVCELLVSDREDLVVTAMSWALRGLVARDAGAVRCFLRRHREDLAPRVLREVGNKLRTGLKNPRQDGRRRRANKPALHS